MAKKILLFFVLLYSMSLAQNIGEWENFSNTDLVMDIVQTSNGFWIATTGGAGFYLNSKNDFDLILTNSQGLNSQELTSVEIDSKGRIWFGTKNGIIDIYNPVDLSITTISDIFESNNSNKSINEIFIKNDTAYISTDFGMSLINVQNLAFISTTLKFGNFPSSQRVNSVYVADKIYVSTENGIAIQKNDASNLLAPESWETFSTGGDIAANEVLNSIIYNNDLIIGTDKGLFKQSDNSWEHLLFDSFIKDLDLSENKLLVLLNNELYSTNGSTQELLYSENEFEMNKFDKSDNSITIATTMGTVKLQNNTSVVILPNGPVNNSFESITVDNKGVLWVGTGKDQFGMGFMKFENNFWTNYNKTTFPDLPNNSYHKVNSVGEKVYLSNWGAGLTIEKDDSFTFLNSQNSELVGIPEAPNYVVIMNADEDSYGNTWIFNHASADDKPIIQLTPDSIWYHYKFPFFKLTTDVFMTDGIVDLNNTKWFTISGRGIFYFNENNTPDDDSDDAWGWLRSGDGLNSDEVHAIAIDRRGELWIGTDKGMNILANTASPNTLITSVFSLRQQSITAIAVDPLNNKWVGTHQGLFEMTSDGSHLIAQYDSKNSPLPSDDIRSIAIDKKNGKIYIGTSFGMSTLTTVSAEPNIEFDNVIIYPSPFNINKHSFITIDGLVRNSSIKIYTITGLLVKSFDSPGGRLAFWDGKDENGKFVSSGIYILVAFNEEADKITTTKFAVIH